MSKLTPQPTPIAREAKLAPMMPALDPITRLPILILFPHSRCNCRCLMCDIWRATTRDELNASDVARWLKGWQTLGVQKIVLSGGEALLHSHVWALCEHLRQAGMGITLLSTGLLLKKHAADVAHYCDEVVVSLDGPRNIHTQIRNVPHAYERLAEGVQAVKQAGPQVQISARCTVQRSNFRYLCDTVAAAHEIGLDRISFLAADVSSDAFNRPEGWDETRVREVGLQPEDLPALKDELTRLTETCADDFASGYIAESREKLQRRLQQYYSALNGIGDFHPNQCNAPWVSSVIEADGTVRPCFFQPALGNIHQAESLEAILNSEQAILWRRGLDPQRNDICRKCVCTLALREPV